MGLETKEPSKPRRTRGTYSYKFRNYFASAILGVAIITRKKHQKRETSSLIHSRQALNNYYHSSQPSENLVNNFINKARDSTENECGEPTNKKLKKSKSMEIKEKKRIPSNEKPTSNEDDLDDSLKFFKVATTNFKKCSKASSSSVASTSTLVSSFINESKPKTKTAETKTRKPTAKRVSKKSKTQPDIRKAISKREKLFNHVLTENCQQDGLDPDEVQLALAISESMMDQNEPSTSETSKFDNPFNSGIGKVQSITTVLERYGFKCKNNYTEYELGMITNTKLSTKKSRFMKVPTELTRTTADKREELIRLRVMDIMDENQSQTVDKIFDEFSYKVSSFYLQEFHEQINTTFKISSDDRPTDDTLMLYYVESLFEPSFVKADHLLKDWTKVPGRESTPEKDVNKELLGVTQSSSQSDNVDMFQVNSAVISVEPEQDMKQAEETSEILVQEKEVPVLVETNQKSTSVVIEPQEVVETLFDQKSEEKPKKLEKMILTRSCSDLFADTSDVANFSDFDDSDDVCEILSDENSEELKIILATQLQSLHTKLSLSVAGSQIEDEVKDVEIAETPESPKFQDTIDELEANLMEFEEDESLVENNCVDLTQIDLSTCVQGDKSVDLTQLEVSTSVQGDKSVDLTQLEVSTSIRGDESVDLTQMNLSKSIQGDINPFLMQMNLSKSILVDSRIDLTHYESADETTNVIPFDDSLISLQAHIKKLEAEAKAFEELKLQAEAKILEQRKLEHQMLTSKDNTSIIKIDLLSSDEEAPPVVETVVIPSSEEMVVEENNAESSQIIEEDLFEDPEELNFICTNNSQMEDQIISDEEINYSIKKFYSYKDCEASQDSQESQGSPENEIIPPAAPCEEEEIFFELENWRDDVFGESMTAEPNFNINESVMGLLETSVIPEVINKKDHSTRFHDSEILSDSIREILKKYQDPKVKEVSSRSLKKMQSETNLLNESRKQRKSVHFNFNDDFNENDTPCSPVAAPKKIQSIDAKTAPRTSLGIPKDNEYLIDTSRKFPDPDFHSMTPVELKQQLFKIGVRPLPVKKAIELLEYIYEQLHPQIRIAADEEIDVNDSRLLMNATDIITNINVLDSDDFVFTPGLVEDEDYVLPKMRKTKIPTCKIPLHISFYNMVRSNEKLQKYILEYRPIELDQAYKHFRKFGITYQLPDIIAFLDKRCITFKTKDNGIQQARVKKKEKRDEQRTQKKTQQSQFPA
ncbi:unnamed protein product [Diamesa tonsa]